jgi:hypothetical protein
MQLKKTGRKAYAAVSLFKYRGEMKLPEYEDIIRPGNHFRFYKQQLCHVCFSSGALVKPIG